VTALRDDVTNRVEELTSAAATVDVRASTVATRKIPGEAGVWIFILGDMCAFAVFFAVFLSERSTHRELFELSSSTLNKDFGAINTVFLLISSLLVLLAIRAVRSAQRTVAQRLIVGSFLCGLAFIVVKIFEYHERIAAGQTPSTNGFYLLYFVLTGLHLFHLVIGMAVLTALWFLARKPELSTNQTAFFEGGACFWHMVDVLWLVLFPLLFLVR
jgi:nitric oxide reductase NorE protein